MPRPKEPGGRGPVPPHSGARRFLRRVPARRTGGARTCWISSSMSGCWRPSSFMGKLVWGSSTVSRYLPLLEFCGWLLAPVIERTKSPLVIPRHPGPQGRRSGPHKFRATARAAGPGPRGHGPQRMEGQPQPPRDSRILGSRPGSQ